MYKAKIRYNTIEGIYSIMDSTPQYNVQVSMSGGQVLFTHPCIKEGSLALASFIECNDDETTVFIATNTGVASLQALDSHKQNCSAFGVNVMIDLG